MKQLAQQTLDLKKKLAALQETGLQRLRFLLLFSFFFFLILVRHVFFYGLAAEAGDIALEKYVFYRLVVKARSILSIALQKFFSVLAD